MMIGTGSTITDHLDELRATVHSKAGMSLVIGHFLKAKKLALAQAPDGLAGQGTAFAKAQGANIGGEAVAGTPPSATGALATSGRSHGSRRAAQGRGTSSVTRPVRE